jgi:hypothetical protein
MRAYGEAEKKLHVLLHLATDGDKWPTILKDFTPGTKSESLRGILDMVVKIKYQK